ncbi:MAG: hypothetical protein K6U87_14465 [Firmicutes bacterium]|nr:hypothetical protein [Bacillota bacterium]
MPDGETRATRGGGVWRRMGDWLQGRFDQAPDLEAWSPRFEWVWFWLLVADYVCWPAGLVFGSWFLHGR